MTSVGITFPPNQTPERLRDVTLAAESVGLDDLWVWEDCFAESGVTAAASALAWSQRLNVGIGLFPVPLRNVALMAMEIATLARLFPGRVLPGIGHGVLDWMGQVGARAQSPMTLLREYGSALRALLDGEEVSVQGRYVQLDGVKLAWPPAQVPLLVGGVGPKTLALAGELGDGLLADTPSAEGVRQAAEVALAARQEAGIDAPYEVVATIHVPVAIAADDLTAKLAEYRDAGATRISVCGAAEDGSPDATEGVLDLVARVALARDAIA